MKELAKEKLTKEEIRKEYISIRSDIKNKKEKSLAIINKIKEEKTYKNAKVVALYKSLKTEVDTSELIKYSIKNGKVVVLPRVEKDELKFYEISSLNNEFVKSAFGIEEPIANESKFVGKEKIDLLIVPGVCFDIEKNRLGFGKGYYDRFLENSNLETIGICFEEQIIEGMLPIAKNDIQLKKIITDCWEYI